MTIDSAAGMISGAGFSPYSGLYQGPSFLDTPSLQVGKIGRKKIFSRTSVTFRQIVGCRTQAPELIGGGMGAWNSLGAPMRGPAGMYIGKKMGQALVDQIWTELELTIDVNGGLTHKLLRHSYFPSISYYAQEPIPAGTPLVSGLANLKSLYLLKASYDAVPNLKTWYQRGWGPVRATTPSESRTLGNPWSMTIPNRFDDDIVNAGPQGY